MDKHQPYAHIYAKVGRELDYLTNHLSIAGLGYKVPDHTCDRRCSVDIRDIYVNAIDLVNNTFLRGLIDKTQDLAFLDLGHFMAGLFDSEGSISRVSTISETWEVQISQNEGHVSSSIEEGLILLGVEFGKGRWTRRSGSVRHQFRVRRRSQRVFYDLVGVHTNGIKFSKVNLDLL